MLARLSKTCSRLVDLSRDAASSECVGGHKDDDELADDDLLPPEVMAFSRPSSSAAERTSEENTADIAGACGKIFNLLYRHVESTLSADVEKLVLSLHEADPDFSADSQDGDEDIYLIPFPSTDAPAPLPFSVADKSTGQCEASLGDSPARYGRGVEHMTIPLAPQKAFVPRIVITPAPPQQCREMSSCVPVQDTSFGARLTVPSHTALNSYHPPMAPTPYPHAHLYTTVQSWTYRQGHWCAVLPGLEEQERRGIFSRPVNLRRRAMRKRAGGPRDQPVPRQKQFARSKRDL